MNLDHEDTTWKLLLGAVVLSNGWKLYLLYRNLRAINTTEEVPVQMQSAISTPSFNKLKVRGINYTVQAMTMIGTSFTIKLAKWYLGYDFYVWNLTAVYGGPNLSTRAAWYTALDTIFKQLCYVPLQFLLSVMTADSHAPDPFIVLVSSMVEIAFVGFVAAIVSMGFVYLTDVYGPRTFLGLIPIEHTLMIVSLLLSKYVITAMSLQPLEDDAVGTSIKALAERVGFPSNVIYIDPEPKTPANAFFAGFPGPRMIVITTKLKNMLSPIQLTSVVAHEMGHWKRGHHIVEYIATCVRSALFFGMCKQMYNCEWILKIHRFTEAPHPMIPVYMSVYFIWPIIQDMFNGVHSWIQRHNEFSADDFASDLGFSDPLKASLLLMAAKTANFPLFDSWCSAWYVGHPTILERVKRIELRQQ